MVVPDFELICEIMLVAEGFLEARLLARKFITLYTLCKELLSKQVCDCLGAHGARGGRDDKCTRPGLPPRRPGEAPLKAESEEELESLLIKVKEESEKVGLKLNIRKTKIMASGAINMSTVKCRPSLL